MASEQEVEAVSEAPKTKKGILPNAADYGAETKLDLGVFLLGAGIGGGLDAVLNVAGFAEPFVFAGVCAVGALGLKKTVEGAFSKSSN